MEGNGGICPDCGSENIEYEVPSKQSDGTLILPFTCDECGAIGQEIFNIKLKGVESMNSDELDVEDDDFSDEDEDEDEDDENELDDDTLDDELDSLLDD